MKSAILILMLALSLTPMAAGATQLDLSGYQNEDGSITSLYKGDRVDPYFATKALLVARDGNLKMRKQALAWIKFGLEVQREDGLFERYVRDQDGDWAVYANADADDAMLALWLQLLYRMAPATGMPAAWKHSAEKAEAQLNALFNEEHSVYYISKELQTGLLMDNMEVYSALMSISRDMRRLRMYEKAREYEARAEKLNAGILATFQTPKSGKFLITMQKRDKNDFYPDKVAQLFPVLYKLADTGAAHVTYRQWLKEHGREWMEQRNTDFPWGLVAITALEMADDDSASCWQNRAEPMRYSGRWNVLEDAALQHVKSKLAITLDPRKIACVGGNLV